MQYLQCGHTEPNTISRSRSRSRGTQMVCNSSAKVLGQWSSVLQGCLCLRGTTAFEQNSLCADAALHDNFMSRSTSPASDKCSCKFICCITGAFADRRSKISCILHFADTAHLNGTIQFCVCTQQLIISGHHASVRGFLHSASVHSSFTSP